MENSIPGSTNRYEEMIPDKNEQSVLQTTCCIAGGGPAGMVLALLLVRQGVSVTLLEAHKDFDRDFRGDTLHPATLNIMKEIGLIDRLLEIPHVKVNRIQFYTGAGLLTINDFSRLNTKYPFEILLPQVKFLEFLHSEARRYPNFHIEMGARVEQLSEEDGKIRGVRYRDAQGMKEIRADLVVAADGPFSKVRQLAKMEPERLTPPLDVIWFRLPRYANDPHEGDTVLYMGAGLFAILLGRGDFWQIGGGISKGSFQRFRAAGLKSFHTSLATCIPLFADRVHYLQDWKQFSLLSVESSRLKTWYRPNLLFIGDAAHAMGPVGGVGINLAIQDAVAAANRLILPLKERRVDLQDLAAVQGDREKQTRALQSYTGFVQEKVAYALEHNAPFPMPFIGRLILKLPLLRTIPTRRIAFGGKATHVDQAFRTASVQPDLPLLSDVSVPS